MSLAWYTAALSRAKDLPRLQKLLVDIAPIRQSMAEQRNMLQALSEYYKLPLRKRPVN
jgi:hypothetical protein